ncbi:MAG: hypothetical protein GSR73_02690 [Desulfurococcales archaeon]|nr:hypothetical protein [Desulfurococcales archaeon]
MRVTWSMHSSLQARARSILVSAWNDYYARDYEWAIRKAWVSASTALLGLDPSGASPLASRVYGSKCSVLLDQYREALLLDSYYALARDEWLKLVLWGDTHSPGRRHALAAIESAVKLLDASTACGPGDWSPRGFSRKGEYDMVRVGSLLLLIVEGVEDSPIYDRVTGYLDYFDPYYYNVVLTGDEALAYLQLPNSRTLYELGEVEAMVDASGVASIIASAPRNATG